MNKLTKIESLLFMVGGIAMVIGAGIFIVPSLQFYSPLVFSAGAVLYSIVQMISRYEGKNITLKRLRRQQLFSDVLLLISAGLLMMKVWDFGPLRNDAWKLTLTIAAIIYGFPYTF